MAIDSYTKLLMHMNDNTFKDEVGHVITNNGTIIDNSLKKFGTGSAKFNGTSNYLSVSSNLTDFDLGINNEPFTIDFWFYKNGNKNQGILGKGGGSANWSSTNGHQYLLVINPDLLQWQFNNNATPTGIYTQLSYMNDNEWSHIAIVYDGTNTNLYLNGVSKSSINKTYTKPTTSLIFYIGNLPSLDSGYYLNNNIDELRISKGIARWTNNFTPPTKAYWSEYFLIKQNSSYYSIKPEFYDDTTTHKFTPITLTGSNGQPNDSDCTTNGFDDIEALTNTMTKNSDVFKPIDKLSDIKVTGATFTTTDNLTYTVNSTTNIPFKQGSVIAYENGTVVTPSNIDLVNGKVSFSTARTGTMTFDYIWIDKFDIKLYKSN